MRIERVIREDAKELLRIYRPYVERTAASFEHVCPSLEEFEKRIEEISRKYPYIKAVDEDGKILGYAYAGAFRSRSAYNWSAETSIYVDMDERRNGIGRALYTALEKSLKSMGIMNMTAGIVYPAKGEDEYLTYGSYRFHERMGFEAAGIFKEIGYKFGKWYDLCWMVKVIGEHGENPPEVRFGEWEL